MEAHKCVKPALPWQSENRITLLQFHSLAKSKMTSFLTSKLLSTLAPKYHAVIMPITLGFDIWHIPSDFQKDSKQSLGVSLLFSA